MFCLIDNCAECVTLINSQVFSKFQVGSKCACMYEWVAQTGPLKISSLGPLRKTSSYPWRSMHSPGQGQCDLLTALLKSI